MHSSVRNATMGSRTVGLLHLSDLHQGLHGQPQLWPSVREQFYEDLKANHDKNGPWNILAFTGDLTQRGARDEFHRLDDILGDLFHLLERMGSSPVLLAVPGNHDLVRPSGLRGSDRFVLNSLLNWGSTPSNDELLLSDEHPQAREIISDAFCNYRAWWDNWKIRQRDKVASFQDGVLPGDFSCSIDCGEFSLGFVGLNSAFLQLQSGDYKGRLVLDRRQFHDACEGDGPRWAKRHSLCLLLTHHGPDWLSQASRQCYEADIYDPEWFFVHLHGHMHENAQMAEEKAGIRTRRIWQACSLFGMEYYGEADKISRSHGYTALQLKFVEPNRGEYRRWPRSASRQGGAWRFQSDPSIYTEMDSGTVVSTTPVRSIHTVSANSRRVSDDKSKMRHNSPLESLPNQGAQVGLSKHAHSTEQLSLLEDQLSIVRQRRDNLARLRLPTRALDEEILVLRRKKRDGLPLEEGDVLPTACTEYVLVERLGQGGFGQVWKAKSADSDRFVAIKTLHGQFSHDRTKLDRFARGARTLEALQHPNIVKIVEPYQEARGYHFFVMSYIEGPTLKHLVEADDFSERRIHEIARQICEAVMHAHQCGFIHRDIKPTNILIDRNFSQAYLTDFDLVMGSETTGGTHEQNPLGTIAFSAPEQFDAPDKVTEAADVCSIARCLLFMYLREDLPLEVISAPARVVRRVLASQAVRKVLAKGCHPNAKYRHKTVRDFWDAYEDALTSKEPERDSCPAFFAIPDHPLSIIEMPAGHFVMGAEGDSCSWDEHPHRVKLSCFGISDTVVTEAQWNAIMNGAGVGDRSFSGDEGMPVVCVSWFDTLRFLNRLSEIEGLTPCYQFSGRDSVGWDRNANGFRLPTEAEWEYAARAGTDMVFSFGNTPRRISEYAWHTKNSGDRTHPVKQLRPNPWHLYDMHGNVYEWVWDWYGAYPAGEGQDPIGPEGGTNRVVRGGHSGLEQQHLRSAARGARRPASLSEHVGFRVAVSLPIRRS
ncbi:MAG: SUMF1/EgtB/PvdO family nonheme iron enzyme [Fimbriimonadaceae bacterium]|nr:SUMF1/EgtB/PvdO family nonheme iron enzyme [Fimbriimonadaceae bacterium]